ncbi:hypothetical protein RGQ13_19960 [Thalassotalea psychrophila]|uniref:Zinc ribbon domain-containing protein n=1 Tax=Thalassotalea psychrophila TaxID=3065647 RepID=A0ABY9TUB2_9GAMM|nr:hypothetical protein RGQ13_19960 [Colwelliaceae bacterium SQ149]
MEIIEYKKSRNKQWQFAIAALFTTIVHAYFIRESSDSLFFLVGLSCTWLLTTGLFLYQIRSAAKEAKCPKCTTDLYEIIESLKTSGKLELKYCPICGQSVSTNTI